MYYNSVTHTAVETSLLEELLNDMKLLWEDAFQEVYPAGSLDSIDELQELLHPTEEEEEEDNTCPTCNGCGEGSYDGSSCFNCGGSGSVS